MKTKICCKCQLEKDVTLFGNNKRNKDGLQYYCKECNKILSKKQNDKRYLLKKEWAAKNREKVIKSRKKYNEKNKKKVEEYNKNYNKKYNEKNRTKRNENRSILNKEHRKTKPIFVIKELVRRRINKIITNKTKKSFDIVGCTPEELKCYLECKFTNGMTWDNRGLYGWHIDHIIPLSSAKTEEEMYKLCHYTNLQPLWAEDNLKKSDRLQ